MKTFLVFYWVLLSICLNLLNLIQLFKIIGTYLYIEGDPPISTGYRAILESDLFLPTPTSGACFDFWYHMYGSGTDIKIGILRFYNTQSFGNNFEFLFFRNWYLKCIHKFII